MKKVSIKKIKKFIELEKPDNLSRYLLSFIPKEKQKQHQETIEKYAKDLMKKDFVDKKNIMQKLEELEALGWIMVGLLD